MGNLDTATNHYFMHILSKAVLLLWIVFGFLDLFNISYSRELYHYSKFLHFEEIVRVKIAVHFEIIVIEAYTTF